jgi:hypothetical protein
MKPRTFFQLMLIVGALSLAFAWVLIMPTPDARAGTPGAVSAVTLNPASALEHQAETVRLGYTADITFTPAYTTYLPLIVNVFPPPPAGIYGTVTYQGIPIDGLGIELLLCNPTTTGRSCLWTLHTTTQWGGRYQFLTAASLGSNQTYFVLFSNPANDARFLTWYSFSLYAYTAGQTLAGGDFDVADMVLLSPSDMADVGLPTTFEWQQRLGAPSDSYIFGLYTSGKWWPTPELGHVGNYTLGTLPAGFTLGVQYFWGVWVLGLGDSIGYTNQIREITFH